MLPRACEEQVGPGLPFASQFILTGMKEGSGGRRGKGGGELRKPAPLTPPPRQGWIVPGARRRLHAGWFCHACRGGTPLTPRTGGRLPLSPRNDQPSANPAGLVRNGSRRQNPARPCPGRGLDAPLPNRQNIDGCRTDFFRPCSSVACSAWKYMRRHIPRQPGLINTSL